MARAAGSSRKSLAGHGRRARGGGLGREIRESIALTDVRVVADFGLTPDIAGSPKSAKHRAFPGWGFLTDTDISPSYATRLLPELALYRVASNLPPRLNEVLMVTVW